MNNFVFGADPLLYSNTMPRNQEFVPDQDIKRQLDNVMQHYQQLQQTKQSEPPQKDWLGDFDNALKSLDEDVEVALSNDPEFAQLNLIVQQDIQNEIMQSIKWKLNNKPETIHRVKRMMDIIEHYNHEKHNEDKRQMAEISDYLQNYSDMTFNEYKQMKASK
jgi:hypothetical protein